VSHGEHGGSPTVVKLSFLGRSRYFFLSSSSSFILRRAEWTPFQTHRYSENLVAPGIEPGTSGSVSFHRVTYCYRAAPFCTNLSSKVSGDVQLFVSVRTAPAPGNPNAPCVVTRAADCQPAGACTVLRPLDNNVSPSRLRPIM
jgi:hypothetical protein